MRSFQLFADISSNNAGFDAGAYRRAGHRLVSIKSTEGADYINPQHAEWSRRAHDSGVRVMHYHYCRPPERGGDTNESAFFWRVVKPTWRKGDLLAFDLEQTGGKSWEELRLYFARLVTSLTNISGHHARLYGDESFIRSLHPVGLVPGGLCWEAKWSQESAKLPRGLRLWAKQYTDGVTGPRPHAFAGVGLCDGSLLNLRSALRLLTRP
jgi:lysozyme